MLKIVKFPDPILRERMPEFDFSNPVVDPHILEKDMIDFMSSNSGIGLAANQVGIKTRMFVMGEKEHATGIFNPSVVSATEVEEDLEGCLSFPGVYVNIKRPKKIHARWQNSNGEWQEAEIEGFTARCFLHELDHLEGIVYQDRISPLKWALGIKKSKKRQRKS